MDGVITDTMPYHYRAWKNIFNSLGINISKFDIYYREGQRGIQGVKEICEKYNACTKRQYLIDILNAKEENFKKIVKIKFIKGSRSFLKKLKSKGYRLALVTGTARHEAEKILPKHIYNLFETVITGSDVKKGKPHPEPFLKALKHLKIKQTEAIVIENAPFGIESAKNAGIFCVAIETSLSKKYLKKADIILPSINSLKKYF